MEINNVYIVLLNLLCGLFAFYETKEDKFREFDIVNCVAIYLCLHLWSDSLLIFSVSAGYFVNFSNG